MKNTDHKIIKSVRMVMQKIKDSFSKLTIIPSHPNKKRLSSVKVSFKSLIESAKNTYEIGQIPECGHIPENFSRFSGSGFKYRNGVLARLGSKKLKMANDLSDNESDGMEEVNNLKGFTKITKRPKNEKENIILNTDMGYSINPNKIYIPGKPTISIKYFNDEKSANHIIKENELLATLKTNLSDIALPEKLTKDFKTYFLANAIEKKIKFLEIYKNYMCGIAIIQRKKVYNTENKEWRKSVLDFIEAVLCKKIKTDNAIFSKVISLFGICVFNGYLGLKKCEVSAFKIFELAARYESPIGVFWFGKCLVEGFGTKVNFELGEIMIAHSVKIGSFDGLFEYAKRFFDSQPEKALTYLQRVESKIDKFSAGLLFEIGNLFELSEKNRNYNKAFELYMLGAQYGCKKCQLRILNVYLNGELGKEKSFEKSFFWIKKFNDDREKIVFGRRKIVVNALNIGKM